MNLVGQTRLAALLALVTLMVPVASAQVNVQDVKAALPELQNLAEKTLQKSGVPGMAIAVVYKDQTVYLKGFGTRQAGKDDPVNDATVFQLASVSKPITSTILALLVGLGLIDWDDPVCQSFPAFLLYDPWVTRHVTIRDLLCHRSGLPDHGGDLLEDLGFTGNEILHRLRYLRPTGAFRASYAYTNFGFTAAALAAARATGKPWEELAADRLYRPLGMSSTSSRFADFAAAKNRAVLHARVAGKWVARYVRDADAQSPAGGVSSTAADLALWMRLQLNGGEFNSKRIVAARALRETHRPQIVTRPPENPATDRASFYGLGWNVSYDEQGRVRLSHSGGFELGAATAVTLLPGEDLGIAVLTNAAPIGVPEAMCASFLDLVLHRKITKDWGEAYGRLFEELNKPPYGTTVDYGKPPEHRSSPLAPEGYVGNYENDYFGTIQIVASSGALQLRMGRRKTAFSLRHWDRDTFLYQPVGEMASGLSGVTFTVGPTGHASQVVIENLNVHKQGTFDYTQAKRP
jgi:CubicO group peptidase (beta-lactamase class C family)